MLSKLLLHQFLLQACHYAKEELSDETEWIFNKYVELMDETQSESPYPEGSPQYLQDTMVMLTCVSGRLFRCIPEERLEDLRIAFTRANKLLDVSGSPFDSTNIEVCQLEAMEPSCEYESADEEHEVLEPITQSISPIPVEEHVHQPQITAQPLTSFEGNSFLKPTSWGPHRNDLKKIKRYCHEMHRKKLNKKVHTVHMNNTENWKKNLATYNSIVTHHEDVLSFPYDPSKIPGIGMSNGERKLLLKSYYLNTCEWKPDARVRRFLVDMHKPWFLSET